MAKVKEKIMGFFFKMSQAEWDWVERRMEESGIKNKSAFIRKMCIDGHVIRLDFERLNEIGKLLRSASNNFNQIAKKVNSGCDARREDVAEVSEQLTEIRNLFGDLLSILTDVADANPGKRFMAPLTIRDLPEYVTSPVKELEPPAQSAPKEGA